MRTPAWWAVLALALCSPAAGLTQTSSACRPSDGESAQILAWVQGIVTGTDSASIRQRLLMQLPSVSASQISYVTDTKICSKMVTSYTARVGYQQPASGPGQTPSGRLHVVKVGTTYLVSDPALRAGKYYFVVTFDKQYNILWTGLG